MGAVYATVSDITVLGRSLTAQEEQAAEVLLEQASAKLRLTAKKYRNNVNGICCSGSTNAIIINDVDCATVQDFKNFITAQKEANTPITIVIAVTTPTTESVTVPTITTTGGEVSIDVDTTVKPSELDLTYHGWHEHQPLKRENGSWS